DQAGARVALGPRVDRSGGALRNPARGARVRARDRPRGALAGRTATRRRGAGRAAPVRAVPPRGRDRVDAAPRRARRRIPDRPRARPGPRARARGGRAPAADGAAMSTVPIEHALLLAVVLFALGLGGVLVRR